MAEIGADFMAALLQQWRKIYSIEADLFLTPIYIGRWRNLERGVRPYITLLTSNNNDGLKSVSASKDVIKDPIYTIIFIVNTFF